MITFIVCLLAGLGAGLVAHLNPCNFAILKTLEYSSCVLTNTLFPVKSIIRISSCNRINASKYLAINIHFFWIFQSTPSPSFVINST